MCWVGVWPWRLPREPPFTLSLQSKDSGVGVGVSGNPVPCSLLPSGQVLTLQVNHKQSFCMGYKVVR